MFFLLFLAIFIVGLRGVSYLVSYNIVKQFTNGLAQTLNLVDKFYPPSQPFVDMKFSILGNKDVIHIDRINNRITSDRNFIYHYNGFTVKCSVIYQPQEKYYLISCGVE